MFTFDMFLPISALIVRKFAPMEDRKGWRTQGVPDSWSRKTHGVAGLKE